MGFGLAGFGDGIIGNCSSTGGMVVATNGNLFGMLAARAPLGAYEVFGTFSTTCATGAARRLAS